MKGLLFTYAITYGGAAASLFNPFYGLLAYVCFSIIRPQALWYYSVPQGNYSRIVGVALLIGWALQGFGNWNFGRSRPIVLSLIAFISWMALASTTAIYPDAAWPRVEEILKIVLPFLVGITTITNLKQLNTLAWVIVLSQGWLAYEFNSDYLSGFNRIRELGFAEQDNNVMAITMVCSAGLAFFMGLKETRFVWRMLCFVLAGLMVHVVLFSDSRGGMTAAIIVGVISFFLIRKTSTHYFYFVLAILIAFRLAGPSVWERFSTVFVDPKERDASAESRVELSNTFLQIMKASPITGIGPGNFQWVSQNYGYTPRKDGHTTWLQVGGENGVPGLLFLLGFYLFTIQRCWGLFRRRSNAEPELADLGRSTVASLVGFMVSAQFVTVYGVELPYYVVLIGACAVKFASDPNYAPSVAAQPESTAQSPLPLQLA